MKAIYPGSFDPMTLGHANIIQRASKLFDELHVVIANNSDKKGMFNTAQRRHIIDATLHDVLNQNNNVRVSFTSGLIVDYIAKNEVDAIIRGIRNGTDLEYEMKLEQYNRKAGNVETVYLSPYAEYSNVSSSLIRMFLTTGKLDLIQDYVSPSAYKFVEKIYTKEFTK